VTGYPSARGSVAQRLERATHNGEVGGSNPPGAILPALRHAQDWEELAAVDPCWAILPAPGTRLGEWELERFFETGRADVETLMGRMEELGRPVERARALDVGCGVGRHARWLADEFDEYLGVDVSPTMVARAEEFHDRFPGVRFTVGDATTLEGLGADGFDLVQCWLVLIHLPGRDAVLSGIDALVRVLRPGGLLAFQVVTHLPLRNRLQGRRRAYSALRRLGVPPDRLYERLGLNPVRVTPVPAAEVEGRLGGLGTHVLRSQEGDLPGRIDSRLYFATK
jgi:SAM-dependent methyltransferase